MSDLVRRPLVPTVFGPQASYELLGIISAIRNRFIRNGRSLILSGGDGAFAVQIAEHLSNATVIHPDDGVISRAKAKPLSSAGAIYRYFEETTERPLHLMPLPVRPAIQYRHAPLEKTGLQAEKFGFIVVEQAHCADRSAVMAEVQRLVAKGGVVVRLSYLWGQLVPRAKPAIDRTVCADINEVFSCFSTSLLAPLLSQAEHDVLHSLQGNRGLDGWDPDLQRRAIMRATWTLPELVQHMKRWPVIQRIERTPSLHLISLQNFIGAVHKRWGSAKLKRVINWPVVIEVGVTGDEPVGPEPTCRAVTC
ncbi:methyltransferase domain-containing protein [Bradyrhizobium ottawaense]|uniref:methyltransferase domain-containing protein n=1 Tax=Bradyrhizobium ottawaense TaxID=931866 RepID=UPI003F9F70C3